MGRRGTWRPAAPPGASDALDHCDALDRTESDGDRSDNDWVLDRAEARASGVTALNRPTRARCESRKPLRQSDAVFPFTRCATRSQKSSPYVPSESRSGSIRPGAAALRARRRAWRKGRGSSSQMSINEALTQKTLSHE